jgi:hypothetical protein
MNFAELKRYTLGLLDDPQGTYFNPPGNPMLDKYLNNAAKETQKLLIMSGNNYYLKCVTTPLNNNQQDYILPDDFVDLNRLDVILSGTPPNQTFTPLTSITVNQIDLILNTSGQPSYYFLKQNRLVLWPTPTSSNQFLLRLFYSYQLAEMVNDTDIPNIPEYYHEFIGILAAIDGFLRDGRDPSSLILKRTFYETMLKAETNERLKDGPRGIVQTDSSYASSTYW